MELPSLNVLVAVLANPPLTTGVRTTRRIQLAADLLGYSEVKVANVFALPSHATGEISAMGAAYEVWELALAALRAHLDSADGVLLAYGTREPGGMARSHFRAQVNWIRDRILVNGAPVWRVGDGPRHPSRWQRWTSRAYPGIPFKDALSLSLVRVPPESISGCINAT